MYKFITHLPVAGFEPATAYFVVRCTNHLTRRSSNHFALIVKVNKQFQLKSNFHPKTYSTKKNKNCPLKRSEDEYRVTQRVCRDLRPRRVLTLKTRGVKWPRACYGGPP